MALNDDAVLNINTASFYKAPAGTSLPAVTALLTAIPSPWVNIGHTTEDNIFSINSSGGDTTTLRSLQAKSLRTSTTARDESFVINLLQFDADSLALYFGSNGAVDGTSGWFEVPNSPVPTAGAFLAVFTDGASKFGIGAAKVEIVRADDFDFADTNSMANLPIKVTPLTVAGKSSAWSISPMGA